MANVLFYGIGLSIIDFFSIFITKHFDYSYLYLFILGSIYMFQNYIFTNALQKDHLPISSLNTSWSVLSILLITIIGVVVYKEEITVKKEIAIVLGIISVWLFSSS